MPLSGGDRHGGAGPAAAAHTHTVVNWNDNPNALQPAIVTAPSGGDDVWVFDSTPVRGVVRGRRARVTRSGWSRQVLASLFRLG